MYFQDSYQNSVLSQELKEEIDILVREMFSLAHSIGNPANYSVYQQMKGLNNEIRTELKKLSDQLQIEQNGGLCRCFLFIPLLLQMDFSVLFATNRRLIRSRVLTVKFFLAV